MKVIQIAGGILLIALSLFIGFGILISGLKEGDENIYVYLVIPILMIIMGIYMIVKGKKLKSDTD